MVEAKTQMKLKHNGGYSLDMSEYEIEDEGGIAEEKREGDMDEYTFNLVDLEEQFLGNDDGGFAGCSRNGDENTHDVYAELAQKEKDLLLAAELGKALLEKNEELSKKYERLQEEFSQRAEELEQEKHELKLRLERSDGSHELRVQELQADIGVLRNELNLVKSASITDSRSKRKTFSGLTEENEQLHTELGKLKSQNEDLLHELSDLKRRQMTRSISLDDSQNRIIEIDELNEKLLRIEDEKEVLQQMVEKLASTRDSLSKEAQELREKNQMLKKDCGDTKTQLTDMEDKLMESRESNLDLLNQLDDLKMQTSLEQTSRGSLFSELSDISLSMLENDVSICTKLGLGAHSGKDKQESSSHLRPLPSIHGTPRPLATSSSIGLGGLGSNKRQRQYLSIDSDESEEEELDYDDGVVDGPVTKAMSVYEQLEKEEILNAELRQEIATVHNELIEFCEELRSSQDSLSSGFDTEPVDSRHMRHGCLTSFVETFKEVISDLAQTSRLEGTSSLEAEELKEQVDHLKEDLYEAHKDIDNLQQAVDDSFEKLKKKEREISQLSEKLEDNETKIKQLTEEKRLLLREKEPDLALDMVYKQALQEKEDALEREYNIAKELEKTKKDAGRLDHQLIEAIQQKIELSEQLEEWQYDMASLIDEQVQKQMRTAAKEQKEARTKRKAAMWSTKGWNWSTSGSR